MSRSKQRQEPFRSGRWEEDSRLARMNVGVVGTAGKRSKASLVCGKGTDLAKFPWLEGEAGVAAARVPKSLSPRPVPGSEAQHWYKGWETGP